MDMLLAVVTIVCYRCVFTGSCHRTHTLGYNFNFRKDGKKIKHATITVQKLGHARIINIFICVIVCVRFFLRRAITHTKIKIFKKLKTLL